MSKRTWVGGPRAAPRAPWLGALVTAALLGSLAAAAESPSWQTHDDQWGTPVVMLVGWEEPLGSSGLMAYRLGLDSRYGRAVSLADERSEPQPGEIRLRAYELGLDARPVSQVSLARQGDPLPASPSAPTADSLILPEGKQPLPATSGAPSAAGRSPFEEEKLGKAPEETELFFLRQVTVLLEPGQWQVDVGFEYLLDEERLPSIVFGAQLAESEFRDRQVFVPFAARVGITERLQGFFNMPIGWAQFELENAEFEFHDTHFGVGDIDLGFNYLLCKGGADSASLIASARLLIPSGEDPFGPQAQVAGLGEGFWGAAVDLLWVRNYDPVVVYYGIGYEHLFERSYLGREVAPGEEFNYRFGVGFAINERVTVSTTLLGSYITEARLDDVGVAASSQEPISIRMALTAFTCNCWIVEPFARFGITPDANDSDLGIIFTRTF